MPYKSNIPFTQLCHWMCTEVVDFNHHDEPQCITTCSFGSALQFKSNDYLDINPIKRARGCFVCRSRSARESGGSSLGTNCFTSRESTAKNTHTCTTHRAQKRYGLHPFARPSTQKMRFSRCHSKQPTTLSFAHMGFAVETSYQYISYVSVAKSMKKRIQCSGPRILCHSSGETI
jgi:hypothetical protein